MSIAVERNRCIGCGKCILVCPGGLLKSDTDYKAYILYPKDCWGCCACIKECPQNALALYLGADAGGMGSRMYAKEDANDIRWLVLKNNGDTQEIVLHKKDSNKY